MRDNTIPEVEERIAYLNEAIDEDDIPVYPLSVDQLYEFLGKLPCATPSLSTAGDGRLCATWRGTGGESLNVLFGPRITFCWVKTEGLSYGSRLLDELVDELREQSGPWAKDVGQ